MQTSPIVLRRAAVLAAGVAGVYIIVRHFIAVHAGLDGALGSDETEYLHAGWLMHQGLRLYRDFAENHAPFLFVVLKWMTPAGGTASFPRLDLITYVTRARLFAAVCGFLGLSAAAVLVYRAIGSLIAPLVLIAAVMASPWVWSRGLVEIRNDPPALFLFWLGALLLLGRWRPEGLRFSLAGVGMGLVSVAFVWNPKWPLESLVLGVVYLRTVWRARRQEPRFLLGILLPPALCLGIALACIAATARLADYYFFTFRFNRLLTDWIASNPYLTKLTEAAFHHGRAYMFCPPAFRGIWPVIAVVLSIVLLSMGTVRQRLRIDGTILLVLIALAVAATLEIRFIYPYPNVWTQYYVMWSFVAASLYGIMIAALVRLMPSEGVRLIATAAIAIVAVSVVTEAMPINSGPAALPMLSYLQRKLRPGETVWMDHHPIGVRDASYYWFATREFVPFSVQYTARHPGLTPLPAITERDLPVCRAERGLQPDLRFVSGPLSLDVLPEARACLERMIAQGRAVKTPAFDVWDLHP
ncbi:MAG TPA: hypothetical protein VLC46_08650 [Thermoanaerobaculia bacterium]|jgi:hypothetical protein|nr:hypothetical protein [Thermoanaerobaculia bacterium]